MICFSVQPNYFLVGLALDLFRLKGLHESDLIITSTIIRIFPLSPFHVRAHCTAAVCTVIRMCRKNTVGNVLQVLALRN